MRSNMPKFAHAKRYCCEDISLIENYEQAKNDTKHRWICHHRIELSENTTMEELISRGLYYNRPASELIFVTLSEHNKIHKHNLGKKASSNARQNMSKAQKGKAHTKGKPNSEFGKKFLEHYHLTAYQDTKLYKKEYHIYYKTGKCSWE